MDKLEKNVLDISHNYYKYLMNLQNVNGVGFGFKKINGVWTKEPCIHVLVEEKLDEKFLPKNNIIPKTYMGIKTDVLNSGKFSLSFGVNYDFKLRPLQGGGAISIRYLEGSATKLSIGTLGCIVSRKKKILGRDYFLLSNNHVIANFNTAPIGTSIFQPQHKRSGAEEVATLSSFVMLRFSGIFDVELNEMDVAIAKITNRALISNKIFGIGTIKGVNKARLGEKVKKSGAKTGVTEGKIITIGLTQEMNVNGNLLIFSDSILSDMYNTRGDSGSCVLNEDNEVIGLLYGASGNGNSTLNDINIILKKLKLEIYTG